MAKMMQRKLDKEKVKKKDEEEKRIKKSQKEGWEDRYQQPIRFEGGWRHSGATDQDYYTGDMLSIYLLRRPKSNLDT